MPRKPATTSGAYPKSTPRAIDPYRVLGLLLMVLSTAVVVLLAWAIAPFLLAPR